MAVAEWPGLQDAETDRQRRSRFAKTLHVPLVRVGSSLAAALLAACLSILR
jgi:hypothetical protein